METQQRDMRAAAANARAARTLSKQKRWAEEMRNDGWRVAEPDGHAEREIIQMAQELISGPEITLNRAIQALRRAAWGLGGGLR